MTDKLRQYLRNDSCEADSAMEELLLDESQTEEVDALFQELWNKETAPISHIDKTVILNNIKSKTGNKIKNNTYEKSKIVRRSLIIKRSIAAVAAAVFIGVVLTTLLIDSSQKPQELVAVIENPIKEVETVEIVVQESEKMAIISQPQLVEIEPREMRINVPEGETHEHIFKCNSKVRIEGGSTMVHDENFTGDTRHISLDGRAHFTITKHEKPFIVDNINITLKVLGTEFYIDNRTNMDVITVKVFKGHVVITTPTGTKMDLYEDDDIVIVSRKPNEN